MHSANYNRSIKYESFITLARNCGREQFGAFISYMRDLLDKEDGHNYTPNILYDDLIKKIKKNMTAACKVALKKNFNADDILEIRSYVHLIEFAKDSEDLLSVCQNGIELFENAKKVG